MRSPRRLISRQVQNGQEQTWNERGARGRPALQTRRSRGRCSAARAAVTHAAAATVRVRDRFPRAPRTAWARWCGTGRPESRAAGRRGARGSSGRRAGRRSRPVRRRAASCAARRVAAARDDVAGADGVLVVVGRVDVRRVGSHHLAVGLDDRIEPLDGARPVGRLAGRRAERGVGRDEHHLGVGGLGGAVRLVAAAGARQRHGASRTRRCRPAGASSPSARGARESRRRARAAAPRAGSAPTASSAMPSSASK